MQAEQAFGVKSWSLADIADGEAGIGLKSGGYSGSTCLVEWKSSRALKCGHVVQSSSSTG